MGSNPIRPALCLDEMINMGGRRFDILKHALVPEHVVLPEEEAKRVLERYNIEPNQLPKILTTDPVVKAIGAKRGDIIKIIRKSRTAEKAIAYRVVVESSEIALRGEREWGIEEI